MRSLRQPEWNPVCGDSLARGAARAGGLRIASANCVWLYFPAVLSYVPHSTELSKGAWSGAILDVANLPAAPSSLDSAPV